MSAATISLRDGTQQVLQELSEQTGQSIPEIVEKAVEDYRRKLFLEQVNRDFAALRADPAAWAEELRERQLSENTLMDGLDPDEQYSADGRLKS